MSALDDVRERVRERCDLVDIVQRHVSLQRRGNRWWGCCPFHEEKTPSFTVRPEVGQYKCFGCGKHGDVFTFVMEREKLSFPEALRSLADQVGIEIEDRGRAPRDDETAPKRLLAALEFALDRFQKLLASPRGAEARLYLERRGIGEEWRSRFEIGFAPEQGDALLSAALKAGFTKRTLQAAGLSKDVDGGRSIDHFQGRVLFPIRDATSKLVGFGGRILPRLERREDGTPAGVGKYVNSPETALFKKSRLLYGLDRIAARREAFDLCGDGARWALLVEGYTDVIACHKAGVPSAFAALGTAFTPEHVGLLQRYLDGVVVVFDGDEAGIAAAHKALPLLIAGDLRLRVLALPNGEDPADYLEHASGEEFRERIAGAGDELAFLRRSFVEHFGIGGGARPEEALRWLLGFFAAAPAVRRERSFAHIADALQIPEALVRAKAASHARGTGGASGPPAAPPAAATFFVPRPARRDAGGGRKFPRRGDQPWSRGYPVRPPLAPPPPIDWMQVPPKLRRALRDLVGVIAALPSFAAVVRDRLPPEEVGPLAGGPGGIEFRAYTSALSLQAEQGAFHIGELKGLLPEADWLSAAVEAHASVGYREAKSILEDVVRCFGRARAEERVRRLNLELRAAETSGSTAAAARLHAELLAALREVHGIDGTSGSSGEADAGARPESEEPGGV